MMIQLLKPLRKYSSCLLLSLLILSTISCGGDDDSPNGSGSTSTTPSPQEPVETRNFYLGFTPYPYTFTDQARADTYQFVRDNGDIIAHHLDDGIPWVEAYAGEPYHDSLELDLSRRLSNTGSDQMVYVALSPLDFDRQSLSEYWGETESMPLPEAWQNLEFDDPMVVSAYLYYCRDLISRFSPDYFAYGVEVNEGWASTSDPVYLAFLSLMATVYQTLKLENPNLILFTTLSTSPDHVINDGQQELINLSFLQYSDMVAVSSYPYGAETDGLGDPGLVSATLFRDMAQLSPDKPFAIAETGYIAEDLVLSNITVPGSGAWQNQYIGFVLEDMQVMDAEFIIWFVSRDYDQGWELLEQVGVPEAAKIWRDTGLLDGQGFQREGYQTWRNWYLREYE